MPGSNESYQLLIEKLDQFIRKYYINQMLRGGLYFTGLVLGLFLLYTLLEYNYYFGTAVRKFLFYSFLLTTATALFFWVLQPLLSYLKLGRQISHQQAASIIGAHFEGVKDKLINILQLKASESTYTSNALIHASIEQKSNEIKPVPFKSAIDLRNNKKYVKYALPPALILLALLFAAPNFITEPTQRIIRNNQYFEKEAPFHFVIENQDLKIAQYEDFKLLVRLEGNQIPAEVSIDINGFPYNMKSEGAGVFSHQFNGVRDDVDFFMKSGTVRSADYTIDVLEKPVLDGFTVHLDYPAYTGKRDESLDNIGDLIVPVGTAVQWNMQTRFTDKLHIDFGSKEEESALKSTGKFQFTQKVLKNSSYQLVLTNSENNQKDSIAYFVNVIPDQFPSIEMREELDTLNKKVIYLAGVADDDYGISKLSFNYRVKKADGQEVPLVSQVMVIKPGKPVQYQHVLDLRELELKAGDEISYYFEVWDNDGVHGAKSSRTGISRYALPSLKELEEKAEQNNEKVKESLQQSQKESDKLREEIKKLRDKLLQEKELDWQDRKDMERLLKKQSEIQKEMDRATEQMKQGLENQKELEQELPEELQQKQEKLEELFKEAENPEMQELMDKIQEMLQELNKDDAIQLLEQFDQQQAQSEQTMERLEELFKQLEVEIEVNRQIEKLEELSQKEDELSQKSDSEQSPSDSLAMEQEKLNNAFEELQKKMDEILKKNEELQKPMELGDDLEEQMEDIQQDMENSSDELKNDQKKKASESQKKASQKMKKMANQMQMQMESSQMEQASEDIESLRQLLENLIMLSFDQEDLINNFNKVRMNTPEYVGFIQHQHKLKGDFALIEDSLNALAKRVFQIEAFVTEKIYEVNENLEQSLIYLQDRKQGQATEHQRRTMTNVNDLALMLSEAMQQMQEQMANSMPGNQMCKKPGGMGKGKGDKSQSVPMDKITEGQKKVGDQMKKMGEKMRDGKGTESKDFAKAAAQQAALRKMLQDLQSEKQKRGQGDPLLQQIIEEMDKMETDLVNKRLTNEMMRRQQEISTRLLEAEKSEREREWDNKRKSETAAEVERKFPPSLEEYIRQRSAETQFYKPVSPELQPFYKSLVDSYYKELKSKS